jgi:hypothetical protein
MCHYLLKIYLQIQWQFPVYSLEERRIENAFSSSSSIVTCFSSNSSSSFAVTSASVAAEKHDHDPVVWLINWLRIGFGTGFIWCLPLTTLDYNLQWCHRQFHIIAFYCAICITHSLSVFLTVDISLQTLSHPRLLPFTSPRVPAPMADVPLAGFANCPCPTGTATLDSQWCH